jgi:PKD repeat protein
VDPNASPHADFRLDRRSGIAPIEIAFANRSSDPDGRIVGFLWDFGDGTSSVEENPTHTYELAGVFEVTLVVTDDRGADSVQKREVVTVQANRRPLADFRAEPQGGEAPLAVHFVNRSSDPDGEVVQYDWNFGDGEVSSERDPTHVFAAPGRYEVRLTVTDDRGAFSERPPRQTIEVE